MELILKLGREFGLSPSARARLSVPQEKDKDNDMLDDAVFSRPTRKLRAVS
jgi:phage terminase small subunit